MRMTRKVKVRRYQGEHEIQEDNVGQHKLICILLNVVETEQSVDSGTTFLDAYQIFKITEVWDLSPEAVRKEAIRSKTGVAG